MTKNSATVTILKRSFHMIHVAGSLESLKRRIADDRPITEKCVHIIADDRPIAEKCFHIVAGSILSDPAIVSDHMQTRLYMRDEPA